jgi:hypothetical protein
MKIRKGFVSNSSGSNFICDICGDKEFAWEMPDDMEYCEREDHYYCKEHKEKGEEDCPICMFLELAIGDLNKYLQKITEIPRAEVFAEIKKRNKRRRKLYDFEYIEYALKSLDKTMDQMSQELKDKFETYDNFRDFLFRREQ